MVIREPVVGDAPQMGLVHVRAWQEGYKGGLMPDEFLAGLSADERAEMWERSLERPLPPRCGRWVGTDDEDAVVGMIMVGPAGNDLSNEVGEVYSLNVHPDHWGRGIGGALLERGVETLVDAGFPSAILWVHSDNARARGFYEAHGWFPDGETRTAEVLGVVAPETRYYNAFEGR